MSVARKIILKTLDYVFVLIAFFGCLFFVMGGLAVLALEGYKLVRWLWYMGFMWPLLVFAVAILWVINRDKEIFGSR